MSLKLVAQKNQQKKSKKFGWGTLELWMSSNHILASYWQNAHNSKLALWPELDCLWLMWQAISSPFLSCTYVQYHSWLKGELKKLHSRGAKQGRHLQSICELTGLITMLMCSNILVGQLVPSCDGLLFQIMLTYSRQCRISQEEF